MFKLLFVPTAENNYEPYLLRKAALFFYTLVLVFVNILPGSISGFATKVAADSITSESLINYTNEERRFYGLNELAVSSQLTAAAYAKANDMLEKQYWDHFGPTGETPWQFIRGVGYNYAYAGENLAKGYKSSEGVHQAWMASPTHRENILSVNYNEIGIAVVSGKLLDEDVILVVQMFGNITTDLQKIVTPNSQVVTPQKVVPPEEGQIKSIKITSPKSGTIINDPRVTIIGEVEGTTGVYSINIRDGNQVIGNVKSDSPLWEFTSEKDLTDGNHILEANSGKDDKFVSDKVKVEIDTIPPKITSNSISVTGRKITIGVSETNLTVTLILDSKTYKVELDGDGVYSISIPTSVIKIQKASLLASDTAGNTMEMDVLDIVKVAVANNDTQSQVLGTTSIFSRITGKDIVNLVLAVFIGFLLILEIAYYKKLGKLHERVHSIFFVGMWLFLAFYSVLIGFGGSVYV